MQHWAHPGRWLALVVAVVAMAVAMPLAPEVAAGASASQHPVAKHAKHKRHKRHRRRRRCRLAKRRRHGHRHIVCIRRHRKHSRRSTPGGAPSTGGPSLSPGGALTGTGSTIGFGGLMWSTPVATNAALDPTSPLLVNSLVRLVGQGASSGNPAWISINQCSIPIFTVSSAQPTVKVQVSDAGAPYRAALQGALDRVPLPANAYASDCRDQEAVVFQPSTDRMWDFWHLTHDASGWHADWGGATEHVTQSPGSYGPGDWPNATYTWGATASSLTLAGGIIRVNEFRAGVIPHAIGLMLPTSRRGQWAWPAQRTDGQSTAPDSIPYGAHFRLDPTLDVDAMNIPPATKILARAAQQYGLVVYDSTGSGVSFTAEMTPPGQANPWPQLLGGSPGDIMAAFPWSHLQLLKMDLRTTQGPATP